MRESLSQTVGLGGGVYNSGTKLPGTRLRGCVDGGGPSWGGRTRSKVETSREEVRRSRVRGLRRENKRVGIPIANEGRQRSRHWEVTRRRSESHEVKEYNS